MTQVSITVISSTAETHITVERDEIRTATGHTLRGDPLTVLMEAVDRTARAHGFTPPTWRSDELPSK